MKISLNSIRGMNKSYGCADNIIPSNTDELINKIGSQLGAIDEVIDLGKRYELILIVKVLNCQKLEGSDHLSVCTIDDGGKAQNVDRDNDGHVQVVCGAPNVKAGMLAVWLPPGATVPSTMDKDPLVLEARNIRGVKSNGMLASPKELALGDNHEGLLEINEDVQPGALFVEAYGLAGDQIIDIENKMFTHRPDCFGTLGVAREIAGIQQMAFKSPDWYGSSPDLPKIEGETLPLEVSNELSELVPRFTAIAISGVEVKPSPLWLQLSLSRLDVRPINLIVDLTNYYMLLTGQPLHAYDYDKVKANSEGQAKLVVRSPKPGEKIKLLGGKVIEPRPEDIMIATDKELIGLGGVMGGADTEVDSNTKNIILECANFDMYATRRTAMAHGLFTDAVTRFTKGQSPLQNLAVLLKTIDDIKSLAGGRVASAVIDDNHVKNRDWVHPPVPVSAEFINIRLGLSLPAEEMKQLLENVEFKVEVAGEELTVTAPFWRTDIELREDVVEEVGRLYGYDQLPLKLPRRDIAPAAKNTLLELKDQVRTALAKAGANELLTYSFVHGNLLDKAGQDKAQAFQLANAISPELQYYRLSLTPSLLEKVHPNIKAGYDQFAIFEIGKGHNLTHKGDDDGLPTEFEMLELVYAASEKSAANGTAYYVAKKYVTELADGLGLELEFRPFEQEENYEVAKPYDRNRSAKIFGKGTDMALGMVGEYKDSVRQSLKLPSYCAGFGIGLSQLLKAVQAAPKSYVPLPRFPKVTQDITLKVPVELAYRELFDYVGSDLNKGQPKNCLSKLTPLSIYQKEDDKAHKQVSLRLDIASYERTLTDTEVNALLDRVAESAKTMFAVERV